MWKLNNVSVYPLVILAEGVVTKNFLKCTENTGLTPPKKIKSGAKSDTITNLSDSLQIPGTRFLIIGDRMNLLRLTA
jgi:hypothetical protein